MEAGRTDSESPVVHRHATGERAERGERRRKSGLTLQDAALGNAALGETFAGAAWGRAWVGITRSSDRAINVAGIGKADDAAIGPPTRG